jgi:hypothetical protein
LETEKFTNLLNGTSKIQQTEIAELKSIVDEFPYFQSARALYLKGLKNQDSFKYNSELKITAAYTTDRTILFDFITSRDFNETEEEIHTQIIKEEKTEIIEEEKVQEVITISSPIEIIEAELEVGKPITFSDTENFSFNQWLQLSSKKPIIRTEKIEEKTSGNLGIIEKFIRNNPKIEPLAKDKSVSISVAKNKHDSSLMTETLAKVYLEQKKYENAMQAYRILSLKYPEKSGFFADQIKRIQILQKNKS